MSHENYSSVIQTLNDCMTACNHCYDACLKEEQVNMMLGSGMSGYLLFFSTFRSKQLCLTF